MNEKTTEKPNGNGNNLWKTLTARPGQVAILVAFVGQAILSAKFQIENNTQQAAQIVALERSFREYKNQIDNLQTPGGIHITKLEDKVDFILSHRIPIVDRMQAQIDRVADAFLNMDKRLLELEFTIKKQKPPPT